MAQCWVFTTHFSKFVVFRTLHLPKQYVFLEVLVENKTFYFSKRALLAVARNKWFKKPLSFAKLVPSIKNAMSDLGPVNQLKLLRENLIPKVLEN